jgi:hypothetical protein
LRASTAFRVGFVVVRFIAVVIALPVFALPVVLFDLRVLAVFAFAAFALALDGAALVAVMFLVTREAGRVSTSGNVSTIVSLSADLSVSRAASPAGASRGLVLVFIGCHVCGGPIALCLRNSRAASSWVRRPRCVYVPGFTLFCLLICGT